MIRKITKQSSSLVLKSYNLNRKGIHQLKEVALTAVDQKTLISNKTECMDELNKTSLYLVNNFAASSFMSNSGNFWLYQLKSQLGTNLNQNRKMWLQMNDHHNLNQIIDYINQDFEQFSSKEKSLIFRIFAVTSSVLPTDKIYQLLQRLENDLYSNIEQCDLVDLNNYDDGLNLFKTSRLNFINKTLNYTVDSINKIISTHEETNLLFTNENSTINQMNQQWLEKANFKNDILFSIFILHKMKPFLSNRNSFIRSLLLNNYINEKITNEVSDDVLDKLAIHSYFNQFGALKQFDRLATDKFYLNLTDSNLIPNLNLINNSAMEKYFIKNILIKQIESQDKLKQPESFDKFVNLIEYFVTKSKKTKNIYDFNHYSSCVSDLFYFNLKKTKRDTDFKFFSTKYQRVFNEFLFSVNEKDRFATASLPLRQQPLNDDLQQFKFECRKVFQQEIKRFKTTDIDLPIIKKFIDFKRFNEPFYWVSNKTISLLLMNIETNLEVYYQNDCDSLLEILERISSSYSEIEIPKSILNFLCNKLLQEQTFRKVIKTSILKIVLRDIDLVRKRFRSIYAVIEQLLDTSCSIETASHIFKSLNRNLDFYVGKYEKETNLIINKIIKLVINELSDIDKDYIVSSERAIEDIIKSLFDSKKLLKFDKFEIDINRLKAKKNLFINDINNLNVNQDANHEIDTEIKRFENFFFFYSLKLRCLSDLMILGNQYDKDVLCEVMQSCVQVLTIFEKAIFGFKIFDAKNKTENLFKRKGFILDLLTGYGLFDYFDIKHLMTNLTDTDSIKFRENLSKLEEINASNYFILRNYFKLNTFKQVKYSFSLLNLKIVNSDALWDLFPTNLSVKDICNKIQLNREVFMI